MELFLQVNERMLYLHGTKIKLRTVPEYVGSTRVNLMSIWEDVKFFRATRVLSVCTRTRVYATIVILRSLENVQFLRAKLYGDFCNV